MKVIVSANQENQESVCKLEQEQGKYLLLVVRDILVVIGTKEDVALLSRL